MNMGWRLLWVLGGLMMTSLHHLYTVVPPVQSTEPVVDPPFLLHHVPPLPRGAAAWWNIKSRLIGYHVHHRQSADQM